MIFSAAVVVSVLSLFPFARAATLRAREGDCPFVCPDTDLAGTFLDKSFTGDTTISCSYVKESFNLCTYDSTNGTSIGDTTHCPDRAIQKCTARRGRGLKQAVVRRGAPDEHANKRGTVPRSNVGWNRRGFPSPGPKRDVVPSSTSDWYPYTSPPSTSPSWSKPKPSPSPSPQQPCNFRCPQQDLAANPLTDEAFRDPFLFCSFSTPPCETCSFCKYSMRTGLLLEDNDEGNCPLTASVARPWDRRNV